MSAIGDAVSGVFDFLGESEEESSSETASTSTTTSELNPYLLDVFRSDVESAQSTGTKGLEDIGKTESAYVQSLSDISNLKNTYQDTFQTNLKTALEELQPQYALSGLTDSALGLKVSEDVTATLVNEYLEQSGQFELDVQTLYNDALAGLSALQELPLEYSTALINAILGQASQGTATSTTTSTGTSESEGTAIQSPADTLADLGRASEGAAKAAAAAGG